MDPTAALARGRLAFERGRWKEAYDMLLAADGEQPLEPVDLEHLATAAHLIGRDADVGAIWTRAHHGHLEHDDVAGAVRCAFWLALPLILRGDRAQSGGWIARATRMLDEHDTDCAERGYLVFARALSAAVGGDPHAARELFIEAIRVGERFDDRSLIAFARHGQGRALIGLGEIAQGASLLDEVMVAITSGEVAPMLIGDVYCSMIEACHEMVDMRRAQEWTVALHAWCADRPDMAPYRGQCLVHRAELLTLSGAWPSAAEEAERARECLSEPPPPHRAIGAAFYQIGELHRLRGEFASAEEAYRQASRHGRDPQPGLAMLRLACGQVEAARTVITRAMADPGLRRRRSWILPASVEILLAARDAAGARVAADELARIAHVGTSAFLRARSAHATGAVLLAEGDAHGALGELRRAASLWRELEAPYDAARTRTQIGLACRALGDEESAVLELEAAHAELEALGAAPDAARVLELIATAATPSSVLTSREVEVIRLIATGGTNRVIAGALGISEKTVARHVSNIFTKLSLSSRSAATAYAYEHGLLAGRT
jgi:DNA-binding CsgD family transcriptional regulator